MSIKATRRQGVVSLEGWNLEAIEEPKLPVDLLRQSILKAAAEVIECVIKDNDIKNWLSVTSYGKDWTKPEKIHMETVVWITEDDPLTFTSDLREMFDDLFRMRQGYEKPYDEIVSFAQWLNQRLEENGLTVTKEQE